jgi:hypothetical protein
MPCACACIHVWNAARVLGSKARRISSSSTVSEICERASVPFSGTALADGEPGVSST